MTEPCPSGARKRGPWVGDQVYDDVAGRAGIITDVCGGTYVMRPVYGAGEGWVVTDSMRLTVTVSRERRRTEDRL